VSAVVALDVGGSMMKAAVVDPDGQVLASEFRATPGEHAADGVVSYAAELAARVPDAVAVGMVVPGVIDEDSGFVHYATDLALREVPLRDLAQQRLGLTVSLGHDVRAGGLAEGLFGAARGVDDFLFLPIGTGVAGAIFLGGIPYAGAAGQGGEIGHSPVLLNGERCACGQIGCLETYASAASVARRYVQQGGPPGTSMPEIVNRASTGDLIARRVWADAVAALACALTTYTMLLDPELIVIGGGLAEAGSALLGPLGGALAERLVWRQPPALAGSALGSAAGTFGAAVLAWRAVGYGDAGVHWRLF
jgi:glucokinase